MLPWNQTLKANVALKNKRWNWLVTKCLQETEKSEISFGWKTSHFDLVIGISYHIHI